MNSFNYSIVDTTRSVPGQEGLISWWKDVRERWKKAKELKKAKKEYRPALVAWVKAHPIPKATLEATFKQIQNLFNRKYSDYVPALRWDLRDTVYEAEKMLQDGMEEVPIILDIYRQTESYARELQRRTGRLDDEEVAGLAEDYMHDIIGIMEEISEFIVAPEFWEFGALEDVFGLDSYGFKLKKKELLQQLGALESLKIRNPQKYYALMSDGLGSTESDDPLINSVPPSTREDGDLFPDRFKDLDYENDPDVTKKADITIDIDRNEERQLYYAAEKEKIFTYLAMYDRVLRNTQMGWLGQEGFKDFMSDHFTGLLNCMGHIGYLFKTAFRYGWKDFKRSELALFCGSNAASMNRIYRLPYGALVGTKCEIPQGMKGTYRQAVDVIDTFLGKLDMYTQSKAMLATVESVRKALLGPNVAFAMPAMPTNPQTFNSDIDKTFEESSKIFTTDVSRRDALFGEVFVSMEDVKYSVEKAVAMDAHLRQVSAVYGNMKKIEELMGHIVSAKDKVGKDALASLVEVVRTWAKYFDYYATMCNDLNRIDHNLALNLNNLKASL